jgi:hypothetical protein
MVTRSSRHPHAERWAPDAHLTLPAYTHGAPSVNWSCTVIRRLLLAGLIVTSVTFTGVSSCSDYGTSPRCGSFGCKCESDSDCSRGFICSEHTMRMGSRVCMEPGTL